MSSGLPTQGGACPPIGMSAGCGTAAIAAAGLAVCVGPGETVSTVIRRALTGADGRRRRAHARAAGSGAAGSGGAGGGERAEQPEDHAGVVAQAASRVAGLVAVRVTPTATVAAATRPAAKTAQCPANVHMRMAREATGRTDCWAMPTLK